MVMSVRDKILWHFVLAYTGGNNRKVTLSSFATDSYTKQLLVGILVMLSLSPALSTESSARPPDLIKVSANLSLLLSNRKEKKEKLF